MNKNAIVVYIDKPEKFIAEFSWLWKTWLLWGINEEWDLLAFCHPDIESKIKEEFTHEDLIIIPEIPLSESNEFWINYKFINSIAIFQSKENQELFKKYKSILRTDCDVFLTKHFKGFKPWKDVVYIGTGAQYGTGFDSDAKHAILNRLHLFAKQFNLKEHKITHVGSSFIASTDVAIAICNLQSSLTKQIIKYGFAEGSDGHWPGWFKGVSLLYAGELAINHYAPAMATHRGSLDCWCASNEISSLDIHIHAWQQGDTNLFNKMKYHAGELPSLKYSKVPLTAGEYCHWITSTDLETLKVIAKKK